MSYPQRVDQANPKCFFELVFALVFNSHMILQGKPLPINETYLRGRKRLRKQAG